MPLRSYLSRKPTRSSAIADVRARFGPAGGLSQPRRDTADPKIFRPRATEQFSNRRTIFDSRNQINLF